MTRRCRIEVDAHRLVPAFRRHAGERRLGGGPDAVIDHDTVEPAERGVHLGHQLVHRGDSSARSGRRAKARRPRPRMARATTSASARRRVIGDRDVGARGGTEQRGGAPDAARAAGDQQAVSGEGDHLSATEFRRSGLPRSGAGLRGGVPARDGPGASATMKAWSTSAASRPPSPPSSATVTTPSRRAAFGGHDAIGTVPRGAVQHEDVARPRQRFELPREHFLKSEVICGCGQQRRVGREGDGPKGALWSGVVAHDVFRRQVLRVGRRPAVACEEEGAAARRMRGAWRRRSARARRALGLPLASNASGRSPPAIDSMSVIRTPAGGGRVPQSARRIGKRIDLVGLRDRREWRVDWFRAGACAWSAPSCSVSQSRALATLRSSP